MAELNKIRLDTMKSCSEILKQADIKITESSWTVDEKFSRSIEDALKVETEKL